MLRVINWKNENIIELIDCASFKVSLVPFLIDSSNHLSLFTFLFKTFRQFVC